MLGNLTFYGGPDWINAYAEHLQSLGIFLWVIRLALLAIVATRIAFTILLWHENRRANPSKYAVQAKLETTLYARSMRLSGLTVLAFIIFHIVDLTWQGLHPETRGWVDPQGRHDVYRMMVFVFSLPACQRLLHPCRGTPRHAPEPRHREPLPDPRADQPCDAAPLRVRRPGHRLGSLRRVRLHPSPPSCSG